MLLNFSLIVLMCFTASCYSAVINDGLLAKLHDREISTLQRLKNRFNPNNAVVGAVAPLGKERRGTEIQILRVLCNNCRNAIQCMKYGNCNTCNKWCDQLDTPSARNTPDTDSKPETGGDSGVVSLANRFSDASQSLEDDVVSSPTPGGNRVFTIASFSSGAIKELVCKLLGVRDTSDINKLVVWVTTFSNEPPKFAQEYNKNVPSSLEKLTQTFNEELRKELGQKNKQFLTNEEMEKLAQKVLQEKLNEPGVVGKNSFTENMTEVLPDLTQDELEPKSVDNAFNNEFMIDPRIGAPNLNNFKNAKADTNENITIGIDDTENNLQPLSGQGGSLAGSQHSETTQVVVEPQPTPSRKLITKKILEDIRNQTLKKVLNRRPNSKMTVEDRAVQPVEIQGRLGAGPEKVSEGDTESEQLPEGSGFDSLEVIGESKEFNVDQINAVSPKTMVEPKEAKVSNPELQDLVASRTPQPKLENLVSKNESQDTVSAVHPVENNLAEVLENLKKDAKMTKKIVDDFDQAESVLQGVKNIVDELRKSTSISLQDGMTNDENDQVKDKVTQNFEQEDENNTEDTNEQLLETQRKEDNMVPNVLTRTGEQSASDEDETEPNSLNQNPKLEQTLREITDTSADNADTNLGKPQSSATLTENTSTIDDENVKLPPQKLPSTELATKQKPVVQTSRTSEETLGEATKEISSSRTEDIPQVFPTRTITVNGKKLPIRHKTTKQMTPHYGNDVVTATSETTPAFNQETLQQAPTEVTGKQSINVQNISGPQTDELVVSSEESKSASLEEETIIDNTPEEFPVQTVTVNEELPVTQKTTTPEQVVNGNSTADSDTVGSQPLEEVIWDKDKVPGKSQPVNKTSTKFIPRIGQALKTNSFGSSTLGDVQTQPENNTATGELLKIHNLEKADDLPKEKEELEYEELMFQENGEYIEPEPIEKSEQGVLGGTPSEPPVLQSREQTNSNFGTLVPMSQDQNLASLPANDIYFVGDGIKLPLQMTRKDGAVHLSVDLDKLCLCKNSSICPRNHTEMEQHIGTALNDEKLTGIEGVSMPRSEFEENFATDPLGSGVGRRWLNIKNMIARNLNPYDENIEQAGNIDVFKRSTTKETSPEIIDIPLYTTNLESNEDSTSTKSLESFQKFLNDNLMELKSKILDIEKRNEATSEKLELSQDKLMNALNMIKKNSDTGSETETDNIESLKPSNNKVDDKSLRSDLRTLKEVFGKGNMKLPMNGNFGARKVNDLENFNKYVDEISKDNEYLLKKEADVLMKAQKSTFIQKEVDIMTNILKFMKSLTTEK